MNAVPQTRSDSVPRHVAIIMDGNGRWGTQRQLDRLEGHRRGVANIHRVARALARRGVAVVTIYAFSTENWQRPVAEVDGLMSLLMEEITPQTGELNAAGVRLVHLGDRQPLHPELQKAIQAAEDLTRDNQRLTLNVAFNYGGRDEILRAVRQIIADGVPPQQIDAALFGRYLYTAGGPDPDLIIRTGGEQRISNFLLWQGAYSEYYHTDVLWPDVDEVEIDRALEAYRRRQRRYGALARNDDSGGRSPAPASGAGSE